MTTPQPLPMLKPFAQAVAYQRERVPMTAAEFSKLEGAATWRAFYIGGLTRDALVKEAHRAATRAIEDGLTKDEFLEQLGTILDKQDGLLLSPQRLELIAQNNFAISYAAGRRAQMADPDIIALRPYWQYPLGPSDAHTSAICRRLEGFVARHDNPVWDHIYPPNHHNERHLQVLTLDEEQAREAGIYEAPEGLDDGYPWVDGQKILPDPGWDHAPDLLPIDENARAFGDAIEAATTAPLHAKSAKDLGLSAIADIDLDSLPFAPGLAGTTVDDIHDAAQYERAWDEFRAAVGIAEGMTHRLVMDNGGRVIRIGRSTFDHMMGLDETRPEHIERVRTEKRDRALWFGRILPTIVDPFEVWAKDRGKTLQFEYVGLFRGDETASGYVIFANVSEDGTLLDLTTGFYRSARRMEKFRAGRLIGSKARKG